MTFYTEGKAICKMHDLQSYDLSVAPRGQSNRAGNVSRRC
jgi:hypothetical protein